LAGILDMPAASINADDLAREMASGGQPTDAQSLQAAWIFDVRLDAEIAAGRSVVVETVLSSDKFRPCVAAAHAAGQTRSDRRLGKCPELGIERVANQLRQDGHAARLYP
jgi:predicted ABC-type ATPase